MATKITATELAKRLSDVLSRVAYRGEAFVVERNGEIVAEIAPVPVSRTVTAKELISKIGDLRVPKGFGADLKKIHADQGPVPPSPWDE